MADRAAVGATGRSSRSAMLRAGKRAKQRTTARRGPRQLDQIPASSYTDAEQALDAGVALEETAERFAVGEKARKFYALALDVYRRAMELQPTNADAAYNAARVCFILAIAFHLPPSSMTLLQDAITAYNHALKCLRAVPSPKDGGLPPAFLLDVLFNLGVAQLTLAEQIERIVTSDPSLISLLQEAINNLEAVLLGQEAVLKHQQQQQAEDASAEIERAPLIKSGDDDEDDAMDDVDDTPNQTRVEYTSSLITPASALETIGHLHAASLTVLEMAGGDIEARRRIVLAAQGYQAAAQATLAAFSTADQKTFDDDWAEQTVRIACLPLELDIATLSASTTMPSHDRHTKLATVTNTALAGALSILESDGGAESDVRARQLERWGDLLLTLSRVSLGIQADGQSDIGSVQQTWQVCTITSKLLLVAMQALPSGMAVAIGGTQAVTSTSRRRSALQASLSTVSVLRCHPGFDMPDATRATLLDNARVYARKALLDVGLGWMLQPTDSSTSTRYSAPHGGLDSVAVEADAVLALLRALGLRAAGSDEVRAAAARQETATLCGALRGGILQSGATSTWRALLGLETTVTTSGMLDQVLEAEGDSTVSATEREYWAEVQRALTDG